MLIIYKFFTLDLGNDRIELNLEGMKMKLNLTNHMVALKAPFKVVALSTFLASFSNSCSTETELATQSVVDTIDSNSEEDIISGFTKELKVPGEDFKLRVKYDCIELGENKKWTITSDKKIMLTISTVGLPEDTKVWIDNIHMDTSIVGTQKKMDGITQDTMDDRNHSPKMTGFPISDDIKLYSVNSIEGQDKDFVQGTFYGLSGYSSSGTLKQERYEESDYLEKGVYANKIASIFGLLVQGPNEIEPHGVDTWDDINVRVYDTVAVKVDDKIEYRKYADDGSYKVVEKDKAKTKSKKK